MRDAFGGTFLMYLIIIMVVVFVTFMAETLKYVQAYRVKNTIINSIEQYEGFNTAVVDQLEGTAANPNGYLKRIGYHGSLPSDPDIKYTTNKGAADLPHTSTEGEGKNRYCSADYGYCVALEYCNNNIGYYKVTTNISLKFTEVLGIKPIRVNVPGETRYVTLSGITCT